MAGQGQGQGQGQGRVWGQDRAAARLSGTPTSSVLPCSTRHASKSLYGSARCALSTNAAGHCAAGSPHRPGTRMPADDGQRIDGLRQVMTRNACLATARLALSLAGTTGMQLGLKS